MRIDIGDFTFPTKKQAEETIQGILHSWKHRPGAPLVGDDGTLIGAVLGLHPRADEKIGVGVDYITVRIIDCGQPGFWIKRIDGTWIDFSYKRALAGKELDHRSQVIKAMRWAINDQIIDYRRTQFAEHWKSWLDNVRVQNTSDDPFNPARLQINFEDYCGPVCPLTSLRLTNDPTTHVDHYDPDFAELANMYFEAVGGVESIRTIDNGGHPGRQLAPPHDTQFPEFHRATAHLRLVHASANGARARKVLQLNNGATQQQPETESRKQQ